MKRKSINHNFATTTALLVFCFCAQSFSSQVESQNTTSTATTRPPIGLVYPKENATINNPSTFLLGSIAPGQSISCNGQPVRTNSFGFFAHKVSLSAGKNTFHLQLGDNSATREITITRPLPRVPISASVLKIDNKSLSPTENLGLTAGDLIEISCRATPGSKIQAQLGARIIALSPVAGHRSLSPEIKRGMDTSYGVNYQRYPSDIRDLYDGFYRVSASDHFNNEHIHYIVHNHLGSTTTLGHAAVTVLNQPFCVHTINDDSIVRLGPGKARTTPLPRDVRLLADGWCGQSMRLYLAPGHHVWIEKKELAQDNNEQTPPQAIVRTVNVEQASTESTIRIPLDQRLPYQIEQQMNPNRLTLRIFGATSDTDWMPSKPDSETSAHKVSNPLLDNVTWHQSSDQVYEVTAHLQGHNQWGFWAGYNGSVLALHVKSAPVLRSIDRLDGLTICIDPGHGGAEPGAVGPSGIKEAIINLAIAKELAPLLTAQGARVVMTRTTNNENPSLKERPAIAAHAGADLLISIHNNALPDNRDPWVEHGTSSCWYHPQSAQLAKVLKETLTTELNLPDYGTFYENLALCRESRMPSALVEVAFMINPDEYARLIDPEFQKQAAIALLHGIQKYLNESANHN